MGVIAESGRPLTATGDIR